MTIPPGYYMSAGKRLYPANRVPGWLADDTAWKDKLFALDSTDVEWFDEQWKLAGGSERWQVDTTWLTMEHVGGTSLREVLPIVGAVLGICAVLATLVIWLVPP